MTKKTPQVAKQPQSLHRRFIDFFNNPTYNWIRPILGTLIRRNNRLFKGRLLHYRVGWRDLAIAFLLGMLMMNHGSGRILRLSEPAPAQITIKPLPLLKDVSYEPQNTLEPMWVSKLRPFGTYGGADYMPGQCTFGSASRLPVPSGWGNANNWAYAASISGYTVSSVPKEGSVAQTTGDSWAGHVAVTEAVYPDGTFLIWEMNGASGPFTTDERVTSTAEFQSFIYF